MTAVRSESPATRSRAGGTARSYSRQRQGRTAFWFLLPNLTGFCLFTLLPIAASLVLSLFEWPLIGEPVFAGLHNYIRLFTSDLVFRSVIVNTLYFVAGYIVCNLVVSLGLAVWLTSRIRGRAIFRVVFFLPVVTPMVANAVVWRLLYAPEQGTLAWLTHALVGGQAPNWLGSSTWAMPALIVMSVWQGFGYNMVIFIAGLESIPVSLHEAAMIDGAGRWNRFWRVSLPLLSPSMFFATVMTLITAFQVFTQPYILTGGGPGPRTTTLVLYLYQQGFQNYAMGYASAIAWVLFILIMIVTLVQFRGQRRWVHYE